jgi:hypothetical protein
MKKILFLHGLSVRDDKVKKSFLEKKGYKLIFPDLPKSSFEESIKKSQEAIDLESPSVIIGSDRGGAISLCLNLDPTKLILVAPTWKHFDKTKDKNFPSNCMVLFNKSDSVVDYNDVLLATKNNLVNWINIGRDHQMNDNDSLEALLDSVKWALR